MNGVVDIWDPSVRGENIEEVMINYNYKKVDAKFAMTMTIIGLIFIILCFATYKLSDNGIIQGISFVIMLTSFVPFIYGLNILNNNRTIDSNLRNFESYHKNRMDRDKTPPGDLHTWLTEYREKVEDERSTKAQTDTRNVLVYKMLTD